VLTQTLGGNQYHDQMLGHTETVSVYMMIKSTMQFDDIGVVSGLLQLTSLGSNVQYVVKKAEWEGAWRQGYKNEVHC